MRITGKTLTATVVLLLAPFVALPAGAQIQGDFPEVVLFATNSMNVGSSTQVFSGDVVVNNTTAGTLGFGNKAKTPAGYEVKANSIVVGNNVTLAGVEFCNLGNITCAPGGLGLPVYTKVPLFHGSTPSGGNINVPGGGSATVTGNALDISVGANGTLVFTPGVHNVRSITANNKTNIVFSGPTEVRVQNGISMGLEGNINKALGAFAKDVVFYVGGGATLGGKSTVNANFYVPNSTLEFPSDVTASGAFLAKDLVVGSKSELTLASAFVNHPPLAGNDSAGVTEDDPATAIDVLSNDMDPDGDAIMVASVDDPAHGTATTGGANVSYTPDPDYFGTDVFNYQVCDDSTAINGDNCTTATITVTVTSVNDVPNAGDDSGTTDEDNPVNVSVLANDDAGPPNESQTLTVTTVTQGANGSVSTDGTTVTYTPAGDFFGSDSFGYTACDAGDGADDASVQCDTATVTVTVTSVNDIPILTNDSAMTVEDTAVNVAVLGNDNAGPGNESQGLTVTAVTDGAFGSVSTDGTTVTYTPAADANGSDSFGYTACDAGDGADDVTVQCSTASVSVTVDPVNDPPVAVDDTPSTTEETLVSIDVLANDTAGPANENQAKTLDDVGQAASGSVAIVAEKIDYTPNVDFSGEDTFPYTVCDGGDDDDTGTDGDDLCASGTVTVTVTNVNDAPTADPQDLFATSTVTITLTGSDPDGDSLTFSVFSGPTKGTLDTAITPIVPSGGGPVVSATVDYTPTSCAGDPLECDEDSFVFQVDDGNSGTDTATVTINPGGDATIPPDDPTIVINAKNQNLELDSGQTVSIVLHASAPQAPQPQAIGDLVFSITSIPSLGSVISGPTSSTEVPVRSANITYQHTGASGTESLTFEACEVAIPTNCDSATVTIEIFDFTPSAPPVAEDVSATSAAVASVTFTLLASEDSSPDPPAGGGGREFVAAAALASDDNGGMKWTGPGLAFEEANPALTVGSGWEIFTWWDEVGAQGPPQATCTGAGALVEDALNLEGPFTFTVPSGEEACLSVTDVLVTGDQFRILNNGSPIDTTNPVPPGGNNVGDDPDAAFASSAYSHRLIPISSGSYSIELETIPGNSLWCGRGYLRVDTVASGNCDAEPPLLTYTVLSVPDPSFGTLQSSLGQTVSQGSVLPSASLTFTPVAATGTNSQTTFQVTSTATGLVSNIATVNLAIVAEVLANQCQVDEQFCDKGRNLGGGPGLVAGGEGPGNGLGTGAAFDLSVTGPGDVGSSRPHADGRSYRGLVCGGDGSCSARFVKGTTILLYARPVGAGSEFVEWGGDCQGTDPVVLVRPGIDTSCTATFREKPD